VTNSGTELHILGHLDVPAARTRQRSFICATKFVETVGPNGPVGKTSVRSVPDRSCAEISERVWLWMNLAKGALTRATVTQQGHARLSADLIRQLSPSLMQQRSDLAF